MKHKHLFSLLDTTFTTVHVVFGGPIVDIEEDQYDFRAPPRPAKAPSAPQTYVYKVPKDWNVEKNDVLVVERNGGMNLVHVVRVDGEPDIDLDANFDYKWAVQKVDRSAYDALVEKEKGFQDTMLNVERVKQRESLLQSFRESLPEGSEARRLFEQTTASIAGPTVEQADK